MIPLEKTAQVWGICGNLGGGKTLTAVSMAVEAIRSGYYVVSNVTLNIDELVKVIPWADKLYQHIVVRNEQYDEEGNLIKCEDFNPFTIPSGSPRGTSGGKRVLVILDECAEWFDQYSNLKSKSISRVMSWLRHSSKRSQDVIFIVQRREYLNKSFRILVSRWINVDDLAVWRIPVFKMRLPFMDGFCMANVFDKSLARVRPTVFVSKFRYGKYYQTSECLSTFGGASVEYEVPKREFSFPLFYFLVWVASVLAFIFLY